MSLETKCFDGDRFNKQKRREELLLDLAELSQENRKLRGLLNEWDNMFANYAMGGPEQGRKLLERTREALA